MLSIIIPVLNESAVLAATLTHAQEALGNDPDALVSRHEIIVVDGGSTDQTREIAAQFGARVISSARGRGIQMNAGAQAAHGDILLFLHADTLLPQDAAQRIAGACANDYVLAGNFLLAFDAPTTTARLFERAYNVRSRTSRLFYGDSAIWVRQPVFEALGGYQEQHLMEDLQLCRALRQEALRRHPNLPLTSTLPLLSTSVVTSSRRFHGKRGLALRMTAIWTLLHILYRCGASPERLERILYPPAG